MIDHKGTNNLEKIFNFLHIAENLKSTLRYLHTANGDKESSAEHSWRLSLMVFLIAEELKIDLDLMRAVKMALVHDLAESITGDIDAIKIAEGEISKKEKYELEKRAMQKIKNSLPEERGMEIYALWHEFEKSETAEAKFVKALDKLETLTQIAEMGYKFYDKPQFIANYANMAVCEFPVLKGMLKIIKRELKAKFEKGEIPWLKEYDEI